MEQKIKISPFQLTVLLVLSRMFTVLAYTPELSPLPEEGVSLTSAILSPLLQYGVLMLAAALCASPKGISPLLLSGKGAKAAHQVFSVLYWAISLGVCLYTVVNFTLFLTTSFYHFRNPFIITAVFVLCGGVAVSQGLEAMARAAVVLAAVALAGMAAVALGLWGEYDVLNLVRAEWTPEVVLWGAYRGLAMNFELVALLLLMPFLNRQALRPRMAGGWLGAAALLSVGLILMTAFSLGQYAGRKMFPVFAAASSSRLMMFRNLDGVFLAVWVLLGFTKMAIFLFLTSSVWGELSRREMSGKIVWANTVVVLGLSWAAVAADEAAEGLYWAVGSGAATLTGAVILPLAGWIIKKGWRRRCNENQQ